MKKIKSQETTLNDLIAETEKNIQNLLTWKDDDLIKLEKDLRHAKEYAEEKCRRGSVKILEEKLWQIYQVKQRKYSLSDEASDWIHW